MASGLEADEKRSGLERKVGWHPPPPFLCKCAFYGTCWHAKAHSSQPLHLVSPLGTCIRFVFRAPESPAESDPTLCTERKGWGTRKTGNPPGDPGAHDECPPQN